jgi:arylsulfatase B
MKQHQNNYFMKKYSFILLVFLTIGFSSCQKSQNTEERKPNILIIVADDLGWNDVSFHGSEIKTPAIDQLAKEGLEFTRFYSAPVCSPTRAGLLTGQYPDRFNLRNYVFSPKHKGGIPSEAKMMPELLKEVGYDKTAAFGKWHLGHSDISYHPNSQGFDSFYGHYNGAIDYFTHKRDAELDWHRNNEPNFDEGYSTDLVEKEVIRFLNESDGNEPFLAYVAFNAPHSPMQAKEEDLEMYGYDSILSQENYAVGGSQKGEREMDIYGMQGRGNKLRQTFSGMVSSLDKSIGNILQVLEENKLDENTIVWFLSDNGGMPRFGGNNLPLRGTKHQEWEGGVRVVSLLRWPGKVKPNWKMNKLSAYIDVLPTLLNIVGYSSKETFDGISILDAINGGELPERYVYLGNTGIVSQEWKMNKGELFKIENDISETNNVANENPGIVNLLNLEIQQFEKMRSGEKPEIQAEDWNPPQNWTMPE